MLWVGHREAEPRKFHIDHSRECLLLKSAAPFCPCEALFAEQNLEGRRSQCSLGARAVPKRTIPHVFGEGGKARTLGT